jgi:quinolinate synthase
MDTIAEIVRLKKEYDGRLLILAHYYQKDEVYRLADVSGDSYQLALAASRSQAEHIVFCGVTFMAESARMLAHEGQHVYLPDFEAGCPLADMAGPEELAQALTQLQVFTSRPIVPVVYINSSAAVKAVTARANGIVCTSSNAALIVRSLVEEGNTVFFLPDQNLGLNTAHRLGLADSQIAVYESRHPLPRISAETVMIVWDGFCNVHVRFSPADVLKARAVYPYAKILVHPECPAAVTALADYTGSTSGIIAEYEKAVAGEVLFIGTELNLVERLATARPEIKVFPLRTAGCVNMNKITPAKLLAAIEAIAAPPSPFEVFVPDDVRDEAVRALQGMIERVESRRSSP